MKLICVSRRNFGDVSADDLTLGREYEANTPPDEQGMVRIIDDSGEDYLYPMSLFEPAAPLTTLTVSPQDKHND